MSAITDIVLRLAESVRRMPDQADVDRLCILVTEAEWEEISDYCQSLALHPLPIHAPKTLKVLGIELRKLRESPVS